MAVRKYKDAKESGDFLFLRNVPLEIEMYIKNVFFVINVVVSSFDKRITRTI